MSLLTLKPTRDKNVDADDNTAAMIPASIKAPRNSGRSVSEAHIVALSGGSISGLPRLMIPPMPYTMTCI